MLDLHAVFNDSFERINHSPADFFAEFYRRFVGGSDEVARFFANTDMAKQREALRASLFYLMTFDEDRQVGAHMLDLLRKHRGDLHIPPELYDFWLKTMIDTVRVVDREFDNDVETAWWVTLSPGVTFMKYYQADM